MCPDGHYTLSKERFEQYESLLAAQGIKVIPQTHQTFEELKHGTVYHYSVTGRLEFHGKEYRYTVNKSVANNPLFVELGQPATHFTYSLTVYNVLCAGNLDNLEDDNLDDVVFLDDVIQRAFPQPEAKALTTPATPRFRTRLGEFMVWAGCFGILLLFAAFCFFAVVGIRSFFW